MPAQEREAKKNFIAILSDAYERQRDADWLVKRDQFVRRTLLALMASVLNRGMKTRRPGK